MKRFFAVALLALCVSLSAEAQAVSCHFGVGGGAVMDSFKKWNPQTGWTVGPAMMIRLPVYFSLQPSVLFSQNYSEVSIESDTPGNPAESARVRQNRLTIPIAVQWGPDLGIIRPFVQAVPFVDVNLTSESALISAEGKKQWQDISDEVAKYQFGAGLGVGLDIWKFQFSLRYDWRFGKWTASSGGSIINPGASRALTFHAVFFFN